VNNFEIRVSSEFGEYKKDILFASKKICKKLMFGIAAIHISKKG